MRKIDPDSTHVHVEMPAGETNKPDREIMTAAFPSELWGRWRAHALGCYEGTGRTWNKATRTGGIGWVEQPERQREAGVKDLAWALKP